WESRWRRACSSTDSFGRVSSSTVPLGVRQRWARHHWRISTRYILRPEPFWRHVCSQEDVGEDRFLHVGGELMDCIDRAYGRFANGVPAA
ncbi:unnamed protein product, partial [Symbiodinium sp. CCMP2456]